MSDTLLRIRLVVGLEDEETTTPTVAGAVNETMWEIIDEDEWALMRGRMIAAVQAQDFVNDWREVIIEIDREALRDAVRTPVLEALVSEDR